MIDLNTTAPIITVERRRQQPLPNLTEVPTAATVLLKTAVLARCRLQLGLMLRRVSDFTAECIGFTPTVCIAT